VLGFKRESFQETGYEIDGFGGKHFLAFWGDWNWIRGYCIIILLDTVLGSEALIHV
jgi:hypothetical protein